MAHETDAAIPSNLAAFEDDRPKHDSSDLIAILDCSEPTFRRWVKAGILPHYRVGRNIRFSDRHVREILASITHGAHKAA